MATEYFQKPIIIPEETNLFDLEYHLPQLTGTERQILWARLIRHRVLSTILNFAPELPQHVPNPLHFYDAIQELREETSAERWIVYRNEKKNINVIAILSPIAKLIAQAEQRSKAMLQKGIASHISSHSG